ncbi:MAG: HEAT repeat domain-containing protein, partial [bacterium]|nr:HEAT repeat domain-containing protein [bacterium]
ADQDGGAAAGPGAPASHLKRTVSPTASPDVARPSCRSAPEADIRGSLLVVLGQVAKDESLPLLRGALNDDSPEIRRGAILALSEWPNTIPAPDLLEAAKTQSSIVLQVLSLRGYIQLVGLPENRAPAETLLMLSEAMSVAKRADEKKAILSLLSRVYTEEALALAEETSMKDPEVASEAKLAAEQIRRRLARSF